jgi:hypothetical protein
MPRKGVLSSLLVTSLFACAPRSAGSDGGLADTGPAAPPPGPLGEPALELVLSGRASYPEGAQIWFDVILMNHRVGRIATLNSDGGCVLFLRAAIEDGKELPAEGSQCGPGRRAERVELGPGEKLGENLAGVPFTLAPGRYHFIAARSFEVARVRPPLLELEWGERTYLWSNEVVVDVRERSAPEPRPQKDGDDDSGIEL